MSWLLNKNKYSILARLPIEAGIELIWLYPKSRVTIDVKSPNASGREVNQLLDMKKLDRFDSPVIDSGIEVRLCFSKYKVVISDKTVDQYDYQVY